VTATEWYLVGLRLAHVLAAVVWLGGGVYYLIAVRPTLRAMDDPPTGFVGAMQGQFAEWARVCAFVMLATGAVLVFERLSNQTGGVLYIALLAVKIAAALAAFWMAGLRPRRQRGGARRPRTAPELIAACGFVAFILGIVLSTVWGRAFT
jgi:uncharacterized membrane protein